MAIFQRGPMCATRHSPVTHPAEQWAPAAAIELEPNGGLEVLVLAGAFSEGGETYGPQSWLRLPIGAHLSARAATDGCRVWVKEGHLRHVQAVRGT